jgi:ubiquinone/menaquinone biosynthesis C-methylase UbiE
MGANRAERRSDVTVRASSEDDRLAQVRRAAFDAWEAMAPGWERRREYLREFSQGIAEWMVTALDPRPGQTILELGAGTGETGFAAARRIGDGGRLISTDLPPAMVEVARRRGEELGIANAEFRVMDAERIDLQDDSVDGILCRWALMLMADPPAALAESRRVLRPGGRLAVAVMGGPAQNPWASTVARSIVDLGLIAPIDPSAAGGVFSLAAPGRLLQLLRDAGFEDVRIEEMEFRLRFLDFEDFWGFVREFAGAVAILLRSFSEDQRDQVRAATERAVEAFRTPDGYDLPGLSVNAVAA